MDPERRSPRLGYALAAVAAALFALNGILARFLLDDGVSAMHLSQLRSTLSFVLLAGGPLLVLLWLRFVHGRRLSPALWGAVALSVAGSALVVEVYDAGRLDGVGLAFAFAAAVTFAIYLVASERAGRSYDAFTTLAWGFGFATLFWLVVRPPWTFPWERFTSPGSIALGLGVAVLGTLAPFLLGVTALRHLPAPRVAVVATLEPVLASVLAWMVHGEALGVPQITGGALVIAAVAWVQSHPPAPELETMPLQRRSTAGQASAAMDR